MGSNSTSFIVSISFFVKAMENFNKFLKLLGLPFSANKNNSTTRFKRSLYVRNFFD